MRIIRFIKIMYKHYASRRNFFDRFSGITLDGSYPKFWQLSKNMWSNTRFSDFDWWRWEIDEPWFRMFDMEGPSFNPPVDDHADQRTLAVELAEQIVARCLYGGYADMKFAKSGIVSYDKNRPLPLMFGVPVYSGSEYYFQNKRIGG